MRLHVLVLLCLVASLMADVRSFAVENAATQPSTAPSKKSVEETVAALHRALDQPLELVTEHAGLEKVLDYLQAQTKVNIVTDWTTLEAAGIDRDTLVTLKLPNVVSVRTVLDQLCGQLGGENGAMAYAVDNGVLRITTRERLRRETVVHVYAVADIIRDIQKHDTDNAVELTPHLAGVRLTDAIQRTIQPETWLANAGTNGTMSILSGKLIVRNTLEVQREIAELLAKYRTATTQPDR